MMEMHTLETAALCSYSVFSLHQWSSLKIFVGHFLIPFFTSVSIS